MIRLRSFEDEPMTVENLYVLKRYIGEATKKELSGSLYQVIEKHIEIGYAHQEVEAVKVLKMYQNYLKSRLESMPASFLIHYVFTSRPPYFI